MTMNITLTEARKAGLEQQHKIERDSRICDRIKAVLLASEGWTQKQIAQALRIHETTVRDHINDYITREKLKPGSGGSSSKLDETNTKALIAHLEQNTYPSTKEIIQYVKDTYNVSYSQQGMHDWLLKHGFSYKKPKGIPAKANRLRQEEFIKRYTELKANLKAGEVILFMDSTHPTQETKITYGWIRTVVEKLIATTASGSRVNLTGAIDLNTMAIITREYQTIDSTSTINFLKAVEASHPTATKIHIIADGGRAHTSHDVRLFLSEATAVNRVYLEQKYGIKLPGNTIKLSKKMITWLKFIIEKEPQLFADASILDMHEITANQLLNALKSPPSSSRLEMHILPPYSPNLNPIERAWKVMNEKIRNNKVFYKLAEFRATIHSFFNTDWYTILPELSGRINDKFQRLKPVF
jgi:transposase